MIQKLELPLKLGVVISVLGTPVDQVCVASNTGGGVVPLADPVAGSGISETIRIKVGFAPEVGEDTAGCGRVESHIVD